jgi:hypothetical protein
MGLLFCSSLPRLRSFPVYAVHSLQVGGSEFGDTHGLAGPHFKISNSRAVSANDRSNDGLVSKDPQVIWPKNTPSQAEMYEIVLDERRPVWSATIVGAQSAPTGDAESPARDRTLHNY